MGVRSYILITFDIWRTAYFGIKSGKYNFLLTSSEMKRVIF